MSSTPAPIVGTALAVAALGGCQDDIGLLDDASLTGAWTLVADHEREVGQYKLWLAAETARRSDYQLGYDGLARKNGAATPAILIQDLTGSSIDEARKLANLGQLMVDAETSTDPMDGAPVDGVPVEPIVGTVVAGAVTAGGISLDAAEAIRSGLGGPDLAVTAAQLDAAAARLIAEAEGVRPEELKRRARAERATLDVAAVERGEKERAAIRYVRNWRKNGMSYGTWGIPDEDGGVELDTALNLALGHRTGGPRFPRTTPGTPSGAVADPGTDPTTETLADPALNPVLVDERTNEQVRADAFVQVFLNGLGVDPALIPGIHRAPVRVIVRQEVLDTGIGYGILEDTLSPVSIATIREMLCSGGWLDIPIDLHGDPTEPAAEHRLFTKSQRIALAVRDGGCRHPGCDKPVSWTEAHHVKHWKRDNGKTELCNGILLCRYHHMLMHHGWEILATDRGFILIPPKSKDPTQTPIAMPSRIRPALLPE